MLELTTINTTELTNKKLSSQLNNIKKAVDDSTDSSTSNTDDDELAPIKKLIDTLNRDELLELKEYIERWL